MGREPQDRIENELRLMRELHAKYMLQSEENIRGYRLMTSKMIRVVDENLEAMREMREASQSHTKAILALLDRLDNGPEPAAG